MNQSHRSIAALRGNYSSFVNRYHKLLFGQNTLWLTDSESETVETTTFKQAKNKLGHEIDVAVFDLTQTLAVNALGAISGCIKGGGTLFLILPEQDNPHKNSFFYKRLLKVLEKHKVLIHALSDQPLSLLDSISSLEETAASAQPYKATPEQEQAIHAIRKVVSGHRNRPLVLTSNRGRGKSSAIGMAINELLSERSMKIIICAPTKAMIAPLFQFAGKHEGLSFIAADRLARDLPEAGLLIIDEAAAIPVPILSKLITHY